MKDDDFGKKNTMQNEPKIAPCGIDCSTCSIFIAAQSPEGAKKLAEEWRSWNPKAEESWFRCKGCRGTRSLRWDENCEIAVCAENKGLHNCSQCGEFPCKALEDWAAAYPHHEEAFERLKEMNRSTG